MNPGEVPPARHPRPSASNARQRLEEAQAERRAITERSKTLRRELRERAAELTTLERRLDVIAGIEEQLGFADLVITSGGVSMGARDVVKDVLSGLGTMRFEQVAMRPGKPQGFGLLDGRTPVFALPGNPVSAFVSFQVFVRPALRALQGLPPGPPPAVVARLTSPITSPPGLRHFLRGAVAYRDGAYEVRPVEGQGSHQVFSLSSSNCLMVVGEDVTELAAGDPVEVMTLP